MAKVFVCDRCGKTIESRRRLMIQPYRYFIGRETCTGSFKESDLCFECAIELDTFMETKPEKEKLYTYEYN